IELAREYRSFDDLLIMAQGSDPAAAPEPEDLAIEVTPRNVPAMDAQQLADFFEALSNPTRLEIVELLMMMEATGTDVAVALELTPSAVSYHTRLLERAGVIDARREGQLHCYELAAGTRALIERALGIIRRS